MQYTPTLVVNETLTIPNVTTKTFDQALATQTVAVINSANNIKGALAAAMGKYVRSVSTNHEGPLTTIITRVWISAAARTAFNLANSADLAILDAARSAYNTSNGITYTEVVPPAPTA